MTEEDACIETLLDRPPAGVLGVLATEVRSPLPIGNVAQGFARGAVADAVSRVEAPSHGVLSAMDWSTPIIAASRAAGVTTIVTGYAPVGRVAMRLQAAAPALRDAQITIKQLRHDSWSKKSLNPARSS